MAKTLEQRLAQLEKLVSDFFTGKPAKRPRKTVRRKAKKTAKRKSPRKS